MINLSRIKIDVDDSDISRDHIDISLLGIDPTEIPDGQWNESAWFASLHHVCGIMARVACAAQHRMELAESDADSHERECWKRGGMDRCRVWTYSMIKGPDGFWGDPFVSITVPRQSESEWLKIIRSWLVEVSNP